MPPEALVAAFKDLAQLNDRLHFAAEEALEVVADGTLLVHIEQRRVGQEPLVLTPAMTPDQLLTLIDGMGLALDLDRHVAPSRSRFRSRQP
jgi:hypothetical protein